MKFNRKDLITIVLLFFGLGTGGLVFKNYSSKDSNLNFSNKSQIIDTKTIKTEESSNTEIYVYIDGAINKPGMYKMKENDRIKHLIDQAGGLTQEADNSKLNLALKLTDEMKVHIYRVGETSNTENITDKNSSKININTADISELMKITGVGETKAKQIIEYREKHRFNKIEDILKVNGIGKKTFEKIKDEISVD